MGARYAIYEAIDAGRIDLAVMIFPNPMRNRIIEPLIEERLKVVSAASSRPFRGRITIADLRGLPLLMLPRPSGIRTVLDGAAVEAGFEFDVRYELADVSTHIELAERGLSHAILSRSALRDHKGMRSVICLPIERLQLTRALVHNVGRMQSPAVMAVADAIRLRLRKLAVGGARAGHIRLAPPT